MFALKKIVTYLILPPGILIIYLIFLEIYLLVKKKWRMGVANLLFTALIYSLSISPVVTGLMNGLEYRYPIPSKPKGDVIILLGGGAYSKVPDISGTGRLSELSLIRTITAYRIHKRLKIPIIISGGKVFKNSIAESKIARRLLLELGVHKKNILLDVKSRDTRENARYSKEICKRHYFKKPILVTSAFHMARSKMLFDKAGLTVVPFPAGFKTSQNNRYRWISFFPVSHNLYISSVAIKEYLGIAFYKIFY